MAGTYKGFEVVRRRGWANMSAKVVRQVPHKLVVDLPRYAHHIQKWV